MLHLFFSIGVGGLAGRWEELLFGSEDKAHLGWRLKVLGWLLIVNDPK